MRRFSRAQQTVLLAISLAILPASLSGPPDGPVSPFSNSIARCLQQWAVEVTGAVRAPGIYTFNHSPTAGQAIEKAGGILVNPSMSHVSQSNALKSGSHIELRASSSTSVKLLLSRMDVTKRLVLGIPVDLNQAGVDELAIVPGISHSLARRIVEFRESHGPFRAWTELRCVKGVGPRSVDRFRSYLSLMY
jgi:competence protein ComEA